MEYNSRSHSYLFYGRSPSNYLYYSGVVNSVLPDSCPELLYRTYLFLSRKAVIFLWEHEAIEEEV